MLGKWNAVDRTHRQVAQMCLRRPWRLSAHARRDEINPDCGGVDCDVERPVAQSTGAQDRLAITMRKPRPLLSDIQPTRTTFNAGDRVIARVSSSVSRQQVRKIIRSVCKFAGADIRVLVVDSTSVRIDKLRGQVLDALVQPGQADFRPGREGIASLRCSVVDFRLNDRLFVSVPVIDGDLQRKQVHDWIKNWCGPDVDIVITGRQKKGVM